jgi:transposase-like protein
MQCLRCDSNHIRRDRKPRGKQNYICADCGRQFIQYHNPKGYSDEMKRECLEMYVNSSGLRTIERVKKVHHTTIIFWIKQIGRQLPENPETTEIPEIMEIDELETFLDSKKTKFWCGA